MPKRRARNHSAADVLAGVDANWPFPRFRLTDEQWSEVARLSGIPEGADDARHHIETTIGIFRESQATDLGQVTSAEIRKELEALAARAQDLYDRLSKLVEVQDAYTALTGGLDGQRRLSQVLDVLLTLPKWLLVAKYRGVEAKKRGPKAQNVYWLVGNLDGIREHFTEKKITRSYKDDASKKYITYVCRIADPDIGDGTIEKAMKDRIKRRG